MGHRCEKMTPMIVVDLDGTLVASNTFRDYLLFAAKQSMGHNKHFIALQITIAVFLRKLRLISHSRLKKSVLAATSQFMTPSLLEDFATGVLNKRNLKVIAKCNEFRNKGFRIVLATAAPASYAEFISRKCNFDACIATPPADTIDWEENKGLYKRDNVLLFAKENGCSYEGIITDHYDDLPLLRLSRIKPMLVSPKKKTLDALNAEGLSFQIL